MTQALAEALFEEKRKFEEANDEVWQKDDDDRLLDEFHWYLFSDVHEACREMERVRLKR